MNTFQRIIVGTIALGAALSAFAGPDWALIEKARKDKQAAATTRRGDATELPWAAQCPSQATRAPTGP